MIVRAVLADLWPARFERREIADHIALGEAGLGLDSIEIVELILESAERMGLTVYDADELLGAGPLSLGLLIDHLAAA